MKRHRDRMTQAEVARMLGVSRDRVRAWTKAGLLPSLTDPESGTSYWSRTAINAWLRRQGELHAERAAS